MTDRSPSAQPATQAMLPPVAMTAIACRFMLIPLVLVLTVMTLPLSQWFMLIRATVMTLPLSKWFMLIRLAVTVMTLQVPLSRLRFRSQRLRPRSMSTPLIMRCRREALRLQPPLLLRFVQLLGSPLLSRLILRLGPQSLWPPSARASARQQARCGARSPRLRRRS